MNHQPQNFSRRQLLLSALSAATVNALPGFALAQAAPADARFSTLLENFADEILRLAPTSATSLGLDKDARAGLKAQLEDVSPVGDAAWAAQVKSMLGRLSALDRAALGADAQLRYDTVRYAAGEGVAGLRFPFGGAASGFFGGTSPFPVTQQDGALTRIPEFLDSQHQIANAADAEAYLERVAGMARMLDQETARIVEQAGHGVMPPDFIARTALGQLKDYRKTAVAAQKLVTSIGERTEKLGIAGDWTARAAKLVDGMVYPALDRQIAAFAKATAKATDVAGVHRLPDGAAYYEWALKLGTSTSHSAKEIHAIGLEQNKQLQARIDTILKAQGITHGTVGARLTALAKDPKRFYADNDQGREQLIAYCNERIQAVRALMPKISHMDLKVPLQVKRVPADIEAGAALGYMNFASLDGSRPAIYYINLKSTTLWPKSELATLTAHEGLPGHAFQGAYLAEHHEELPLIASLMGFNAFVEGWALYAEQLVDEFGLYANDPFSEIGYLQAQQFRACRLVVDTGIHAMKWTRQRAIRFLVENTGRGLQAMTSEIDRYCVSPGQACGYKMGHNEILRQRERAKSALGGRFDLAAFNDALVQSCGVPLTVLPTVVDRYINGAR
ncbi:DUF885 family protein [Duganella sp. BJB488]|uniref:DUF885 domain-containing protein n=1 Tax=unclassified Duganella TaxID=2636909 RepID=UPI000E352181|nr:MULTISPECIES: DUF885 family protein [unclassified Duganella]RFP12290.1 DUF885 family protein [Duganella sp. BJB488]RFP20070.1 DUF885 family protein [Duganella sp. BJB489]RFP33623.1 DUF885 family protein [Duganella sp. BJB480]